jgi:NADH:ubiquinone oxidoreductase subunit 5 (subunit L)/multisubunit Na+/H+ antiporter MnhA subunit
MFRQLFMTFFGECRPTITPRAPARIAQGDDAPARGPRGRRGFAGYIGLPAVFGPNLFGHWLEPVLGGGHEEHASAALELGLMLVSIGVAALGIFLAISCTIRRRSRRTFSRRSRAAYSTAFRQQILRRRDLSEGLRRRHAEACGGRRLDRPAHHRRHRQRQRAVDDFLSWLDGLFDTYVIDGMVNAVANLTYWGGGKFKKVQTGSINGYLYVILGAVVAAIIIRMRYAG